VIAAAVVGLAAGCSRGPTSSSRISSGVEPGTTPTSAAPVTTTTAAPTTVASTTPTTAARPAPVVTTAPTTTAVHAATVTACPTNLASDLASTGSARQLITVESSGYGTSNATVELWQKSGSCWTSAGGPYPSLIGSAGFSDHKSEGDHSTPTGLFGVGPVMYGNAPDPGVHEPYHVLVCGDWWDEDPGSAGYNTFQHVSCGRTPPFGGASEALWTETAQYPSFAVIDYNTGPVVPGAGSAIFFHADTGSATVGCVSVPLSDLDAALDWIDPAQAPAFVMGPASEITRF